MGFKELEERERETSSNDDVEQDGDLTTVFEALDIDEADEQAAQPEQTSAAPAAEESNAAPEKTDAQAAEKQPAGAETAEKKSAEQASEAPAEKEDEKKRKVQQIEPQTEEQETEADEEEDEDTVYYTSVFMRVMSLLFIIVSALEIVGGVAIALLGDGLFDSAQIDRLNMSAAHVFGIAIVIFGVLTLLAGICGRKEKKVISVILAILLIAVAICTFFLDVSLLQAGVLAFYILYFGAACSIQPYEEY